MGRDASICTVVDPRVPDPREREPQPKEAVALQRRLAPLVRAEGALELEKLESVGGVDISVRGGRARAAVAVLSYPGLELLELATAVRPLSFPYVPGLLSFRELPAILDAWESLERPPRVALVDGHGIAHPRRFGIACHLGVTLDLATVGCGKSRLVGEHREPARRRGSRCQVRHRGELVGSVLRTRDGVRPVYVSVGHRIDLASALRLVRRTCGGYRLPEPIRAADRAAGRIPV